jgi:L-fuconate dehydratase
MEQVRTKNRKRALIANHEGTSNHFVGHERRARFPLDAGAGSDAVHSGSEYAFATTLLSSSGGLYGTGIALTLGQGNQLVYEAIELLGKGLQGQEMEELMADFGAVAQRLAQHPQLRWLGGTRRVACLYGGCSLI